MSDKKIAIKLSTLEGIGDAIREKEGSTDAIPVNALADRIGAMKIASGENKLAQFIDRSITEITAEDLAGVTSIGNYSCEDCPNLTSVTIPDSVTSIGREAFSYCYNLASVTIGDGVTSIDFYAFYGCSSLTSVTIPDSVYTLNSSAFRDCSSLTSVTIGSGITSIGVSALHAGSTSNKSTITFLGTTPPTISTSTFNTSYLNKIIVPAGSGETYKAATNWANFADFIEEAAE